MISCRACLRATNVSPLLRLDSFQFALRTARRRSLSAFPPTKAASAPILPQARAHSSASAASAAPAAEAATTHAAITTTTSTPRLRAATSRLRQTPLHRTKRVFFSTPSGSIHSVQQQSSPKSSGEATDASPAPPPALDKPADLTEGESAVWERLVSAPALGSVCQLRVQDVSGGCGSMYSIEIAAAAFRGLSVLKQQRLVNAALGDMVKEWHGLQLRTSVP